MSAPVDISSPIWRLAAASGEEPDAVQAALAAMKAAGYSHDEIWELCRGQVNQRGSIVTMAASLVAGRESP